MSGVLEETTSNEIDREHLARRVEDWANRIDALYRRMEEWIPAGWTAARNGSVQMYEKLMRRFDLPPRQLPVLQLSSEGQPPVRIEPRGLWIIGANGRLDMFARSGQYLIVDAAENFEPSDWQIAPLQDRRNPQPLDRDTFVTALLK